MSFGQRLLDILDEKGMSRADLCKATGLTSGHLVPYLKDPSRSPNLSTAIKIADALDISLDRLAERDSESIDENDSEAMRLADGFSRLNRDGQTVMKETLEFQLSKNAKDE